MAVQFFVVRLYLIASTLVKRQKPLFYTAVLFSVVGLFSIASTLVKRQRGPTTPAAFVDVAVLCGYLNLYLVCV
jgi:hypothetical protein